LGLAAVGVLWLVLGGRHLLARRRQWPVEWVSLRGLPTERPPWLLTPAAWVLVFAGTALIAIGIAHL